MHRFASQCPAIGLAAHSPLRQPKKQVPGWIKYMGCERCRPQAPPYSNEAFI
jgi:hypothetical protein